MICHECTAACGLAAWGVAAAWSDLSPTLDQDEVAPDLPNGYSAHVNGGYHGPFRRYGDRRHHSTLSRTKLWPPCSSFAEEEHIYIGH